MEFIDAVSNTIRTVKFKASNREDDTNVESILALLAWFARNKENTKKHILLRMLNSLWVHHIFVYFCVRNTPFVC